MKNGLFLLLIAGAGFGAIFNLAFEHNSLSKNQCFSTTFAKDTLFVGLWKGVEESAVGYLGLEQEGFAWFVIGQDTLGGSDFVQEGHRARMTYEINYDVHPKSIDFVVFSKDLNLEVGRLPGIFEFLDLHKVRLSLNFSGSKRPPDFERGDDLVTLERVKY